MERRGKNLPPKLEKYVEQVKKENPSYSESQVWATAWSIYCRNVRNESPHCKRKPGGYFKGKKAAEIARKVADAWMRKLVGSQG